MASDFRKVLASGRIIVFDGGMGTMLATGMMPPEVHRAYRDAGADVLTTNTFDFNRQLLADLGARTELETECRAACANAREAAAGGSVAGDMGPSGALLEPYGTAKDSEMRAVFLTVAKLLAESGVDLFIVETMSDARETALAVRACREAAPAMPIAAAMAFDPSRQGGFRTNMGVSPSAAAQAMVDAGADIIGANCGSVTPEQMAEIVREFRSAAPQHPILIQPNAGVPELQAGKTLFRLSPEAFAEGMKLVLDAGAQLVGGCCGTTPEHIRCLRQSVRSVRSVG